MGIGETICNYIYSAFTTIKESLEITEKFILDILETVKKFAQSLINTIKEKMEPIIEKIKKTLDNIQKNIKPLILDTGDGIPYICEPMWKCMALLKELLNNISDFYKSLQSEIEEQCWPEEEKKNFLDNIVDLIEDYEKFREFICNLGFSFNFSIKSIKASIKTFDIQLYDWKKWVTRQVEKLEAKLNYYKEFIINSDLFKLLKSLKDFFECVIGPFEGCGEIATAQNFYNHVLSSLHIVEAGAGYEIDPEFRRKLFAASDAVIDECQNLINLCTKLNIVLINPIELKVATTSYENAKPGQNIWPGNISLTDIQNGLNYAISGKWRKTSIKKVFSTAKQDVIKAFYDKKMNAKRDGKQCPDENTAGGIDDLNTGLVLQKELENEAANEAANKNNNIKLNVGVGTISGISKSKIESALKGVDKSVESVDKSKLKTDKSFIDFAGKTLGTNSSELLLKTLNKEFNTSRYSTEYIISNMRIESDGMIFVQDGCCDIALTNLPVKDEIITKDIMFGYGNDIEDDSAIYDPETDEIYSGTEASLLCATEPDHPLAVRCKQIWATINNMYDEQNIVQKY